MTGNRLGKPTWMRLFSVDADPREVRRLRHCLDEAPLTDDVRERAQLVVSELVTNEIVHGATSTPERIAIEIGRYPRTLRIEVTHPDSDDSFDPRVRQAGPLDDAGRGLFIVQSVASRWGVRRQPQAAVWAEIDLDLAG